MRKETLFLLAGVCVIAAVVFWQEVLAFFVGMTPFEAIEFITTFVLKAVVLSIISWVVYHAPNIINPWLRTIRWKQRSYRRNRSQKTRSAPRAPSPRLNNAVLTWLANQVTKRPKSKIQPAPPREDPSIRFK